MKTDKIICLDIGGSKIRLQTVDAEGECGPEYSESLINRQLNNNDLSELLIKLILRAFDKESDSSIFMAISIGAPGLLDTKHGIIESAPNLNSIKDLPIVEDLSARFSLPIYLINDAYAGGLGEYWFGSGKNLDLRLFYLTLSSGVGSSYITTKELQTDSNQASEVGHTDLYISGDPNRPCKCGLASHAESYLSTYGLAVTHAQIFNITHPESEEEKYSISFQMRAGIIKKDPRWLLVQKIYAGHLARFLRNIIMNFQPNQIVLGGGIAFANQALLAETRRSLDELMSKERDKMSRLANETKIVLATLPNPVILGSAKFAFEGFKEK